MIISIEANLLSKCTIIGHNTHLGLTKRIPAALSNKTEAGGVLSIKVKLLSCNHTYKLHETISQSYNSRHITIQKPLYHKLQMDTNYNTGKTQFLMTNYHNVTLL